MPDLKRVQCKAKSRASRVSASKLSEQTRNFNPIFKHFHFPLENLPSGKLHLLFILNIYVIETKPSDITIQSLKCGSRTRFPYGFLFLSFLIVHPSSGHQRSNKNCFSSSSQSEISVREKDKRKKERNESLSSRRRER